MDNSNSVKAGTGSSSINSHASRGLPASANFPLHQTEIAAFLFAAEEPATHSASLEATAAAERAGGTSSAAVAHVSERCAASAEVALAEEEELQQATSFPAAADGLTTSSPPVLDAAERTQQRHGASRPPSLLWPVAVPHSRPAASKLCCVADGAYAPLPSPVSAGAETSASPAVASGAGFAGLASTAAAPSADAASSTAGASAPALFTEPSLPAITTARFAAPAAAATAAGSAAAPVRIAILPPKAGQEEVFPSPLLSPGAAQSPATASPGAATRSPGAATRSPRTARSPVAAVRCPIGAAVTSSGDSATAPSPQMPSRCYSLFPPPSTMGASAQLSPAQTTMSRSPISSRSPGMQTPQQQQEQKQEKQQQELWQSQQEQRREPEQLLVEHVLQQQRSAALQDGVTGPPAEPAAACVAEDVGSPREEQQLQQQLQQLHHSLLAQLSASSATAVAEPAVLGDTSEATTAVAGLCDTAAADDALDAAAADTAATHPAASAPRATAAAVTAVKRPFGAEGREHLEREEEEEEPGSVQQRQQRASSGSTTAVTACGTGAAGSAASAVAASTASGVSLVTSDALLFPTLDPHQQQQRQQKWQQHEERGQQQEEEAKYKQEEYYPALFRSLSAASLPPLETLCKDEAAENKSSSDIVDSSPGPNLCSRMNVDCELRVGELPAPSGCSGTTPVTAERETTAGTGAAAGCAAGARFVSAFPPPPQHRWQQEMRRNSKFDGQRLEKKRHSVAGALVGKTAEAAVAAAAAAAASREWRKEVGLDTAATCCSGSYHSSGIKSGREYASSSSSGSSNYSGRMTFGECGHSVTAHGYQGFERSRNSRSYADFRAIASSNSGFSKLANDSNSISKRAEQPEEEPRCCTGGWSPARMAETDNRQHRKNSAAAINENDRAALRAALLARQDYLQRFLQATQQALSALEGDSEGAVNTGQLLSALSPPASLQSSNTGGSCILGGTAAACCTPLSPEAAVSPTHDLPAAFVPTRGEQPHQQKHVNLLHQQPQRQQQHSGEPASRPSHVPAAALPLVGSPPLPSPARCTASSPHHVGAAGAAPHVVAETGAAAAAEETPGTGRGLVESDDRGRREARAHRSKDNGSGGRAVTAGGNANTIPPSDANEAAAAAAATVAAKAMVAAAASLLEQQRQQAQQQAPQQQGTQQEHAQRQHQHLEQSREHQRLPALGTAMASREGEAEAEQLQLLSRVAHLSRVPASEGGTMTRCVPTHASCPDDNTTAASDASAASPTAFGGRGGIRSRTAPAFSLDDKTMRGLLSFLCGGQECDFSAADVEAASLLYRHGETIMRAANTPYTCNPAATVAAAAGETLAGFAHTGESPSSNSAGGGRRERPRVRFRDQRPQEQQEDAKKEQHSCPEHQGKISQQQQRLIPEQQQQEQHAAQQQHVSQQHQHVVCPLPSNPAGMQLRRMLQLQPCNESETSSLVTASPASSPPGRMPHDAFLHAVAAAAAAAAATEKYERSGTSGTGKHYTNSPVGAAAKYEDNRLKTLLEVEDVNAPMAGISHLSAAGVHAWAEASTGHHAGVVTSSTLTPWTPVSMPPEPQQSPQQQQGETMGFTASAAVMRPLLHLTRLDGRAAALEQDHQNQQLRNVSTLFMRPQRRTATLPCTAANVLFQSMDVQALLHLQCRCKPCAFYYNRKGCRNGMNCEFCHHEDHSKLTVKQWKKQQHKLSRQARCLSIEEERAVAGVAGVSMSTRNGGSAGSLFSGAGRQVGGTPPTPRDIRNATIPASLSAFPLLWKDDESDRSSCGSALLPRSGECSSRSNCTSPLYGTKSETINTNRSADQSGTGARTQPSSGHGMQQSRVHLEDSFQADAATSGEPTGVSVSGAARGALAAAEGEHAGGAAAAVLAANDYARDNSRLLPDFTAGSFE